MQTKVKIQRQGMGSKLTVQKKSFVNNTGKNLVSLCHLWQNLKIEGAICTLAPLLLRPCVFVTLEMNKKLFLAKEVKIC